MKGIRNGRNRKTATDHSDSQARADAEGGAAVMAYALQGASEGAPESPRLEVVQQAEPIRAWRGVALRIHNNTLVMGSLNAHFGTLSPAESKACCNVNTNPYLTNAMLMGLRGDSVRQNCGMSPGESCTCGFYGVKDKEDCVGIFLAEVDFYGKIIEHERGYRAEYQRILSLRIKRPEWCAGSFLCDGEPSILVFSTESSVIMYGTMISSPAIDVVCEKCGAEAPQTATLSKVAARLGVEVRWDS